MPVLREGIFSLPIIQAIREKVLTPDLSGHPDQTPYIFGLTRFDDRKSTGLAETFYSTALYFPLPHFIYP